MKLFVPTREVKNISGEAALFITTPPSVGFIFLGRNKLSIFSFNLYSLPNENGQSLKTISPGLASLEDWTNEETFYITHRKEATAAQPKRKHRQNRTK